MPVCGLPPVHVARSWVDVMMIGAFCVPLAMICAPRQMTRALCAPLAITVPGWIVKVAPGSTKTSPEIW